MNAAPRIPDPIAKIVAAAEKYGELDELYPAFKWLRTKRPLAQVQMPHVRPFWIVTKHADILEISRRNDLFHSGELPLNLTDIETEAWMRALSGGRPNFIVTLLDMDGELHRNSRFLTQGWFMAQNIRRLEERIREVAKGHVDRMAELGSVCDFANDIANTYPLQVLLDLLGMPREDAQPVLRLTQQFLNTKDPDLCRSGLPPTPETQRKVLNDLWMYLKPHVDVRRGNPRDDLLSVLVNGVVGGEPLSEFNLMSYFIMFILAGHDTTSFAAAGGVMGLCQFPGQFEKLRADASLCTSWVEEAVRWTTPVKHFMRTAMVDYELRGQQIRAGDWLMLAYPSGNRDEEVFDEPESFFVDRNPNRHLSFGSGSHLCLGQHLAKLELRILFEELASRLKSIESNGGSAIAQGINIGGPKRVPVRYLFN